MSYLYDPNTNKKVDDLKNTAVTDVSVTNNNGTYSIKKTVNGKQTQVGSIKTEPNPVVEVKDSVVENNTDGYDSHTLSETLSDGTNNKVEQFYIAQNQITNFTTELSKLLINKVDQTGKSSSETFFEKTKSEDPLISNNWTIINSFRISGDNGSILVPSYAPPLGSSHNSSNLSLASKSKVSYNGFNQYDLIFIVLKSTSLPFTTLGPTSVGASTYVDTAEIFPDIYPIISNSVPTTASSKFSIYTLGIAKKASSGGTFDISNKKIVTYGNQYISGGQIQEVYMYDISSRQLLINTFTFN